MIVTGKPLQACQKLPPRPARHAGLTPQTRGGPPGSNTARGSANKESHSKGRANPLLSAAT
ncbi:hypothetical protein GCM10027514_04340 [Azotobacter armeniacus]